MARRITDSLAEHGLLGVALHESFSNICEIVPHAHEIPRLGGERMMSGRPWRFLDRSLLNNGYRVGWHIDTTPYKTGAYGKIFRSWRMVARQRTDGLFDVAEDPVEVIVKQTLPSGGRTVLTSAEITAHIVEGLLHVLAWRAVQGSAAPWSVPRPFEIFGDHSPALPGWRSMSLCMDWVRGRTLQSYAEKHWRPGGTAGVGVAFLEILAQVAYVLWVIQGRLHMNHRDLKVNNLMIRARREEPAVLELGGVRMTTRLELTLIDFGFACVGCGRSEPLRTFQTGSFFPAGELCCKAGRDLAQMIYCIHCYFPLDRYLPRLLYDAVRRWMTVRTRELGVVCMLDGFTEEGAPLVGGGAGADYNKGIYEFLRRGDVEPVACEPVALFRECCRLKAVLAPSG